MICIYLKACEVLAVAACILTLTDINLVLAKNMCRQGLIAIPGQMLCPNCRFRASKPEEETYGNDNGVDDNTSIEEEHELELTGEPLNSTLSELEISPIKFHSIAPHSKPSLRKRKLEQVEGKVTKKACKCFET